MTPTTKLQNDCRRERQLKEEQIYREFCDLTADPANDKMAVTHYLMRKYKIHAPSTIWHIRRRVESRLNPEC